MDNEMIECAAQACFEKLCPGIRYTEQDKEFYKEAQIAAIKAMREPTEKIKTIKTMSIDYSSEEIWQSFINAIIGEK